MDQGAPPGIAPRATPEGALDGDQRALFLAGRELRILHGSFRCRKAMSST